MSDEPQNPLDGLLSDFALGPAWARGKSEKKKNYSRETGEREYKPRKGGDRQFRGNREGGDRRQQGRGNRRDQGNNRNFQPREQIAPAEGVTVTLTPEKTAIQAICKEVHQVARVYSLFDVAQTILAERNRSLATFEISDKKPEFFRCKIDEAIFLTKEEAIQHLMQADWRDRFIEESTIEVDPPKGSFQSVARCGISGEWLGPPNFHAYQTNLRRLHRERFANMPFEAYAAKARTERGEEAVNAWLESMKVQTRWRILTKEEYKAKKAAEAAERKATEAPPAADTPPAESTSETPTEEIAEAAKETITEATEAVDTAVESAVEGIEAIVDAVVEKTTEAVEAVVDTPEETPAAEAPAEKEEARS